MKAASIYQQGYGTSAQLMLPAENLVRPLKLLGLLPQDKEKEKIALDIGCGDGRHVQYLDQHGFKVHATDVGEQAIQLSKQRKYSNKPTFHLLPLSSTTNNEISKNKFDVIICWETIHWFGGRNVILRELKTIKSMLKSAGTFVFTLVKEDDYRLSNSTLADKQGCLHRIYLPERKDCLMYQEDFNGYTNLIKSAGLEINYVGWYSWGRHNVSNNELNFGSSGVFSMYVIACQITGEERI